MKSGNGLNISFWRYFWLSVGRLVDLVDWGVTTNENVKVRDFIVDGGRWDEKQVCQVFHAELANLVRIPLPRWCHPQDNLVWGLKNKGVFMKSAFLSLCRLEYLGPQVFNWRVLWKLSVVPKVTSFL